MEKENYEATESDLQAQLQESNNRNMELQQNSSELEQSIQLLNNDLETVQREKVPLLYL